MPVSSNPTKLQTLFWEIKNRFFYIAISFFFTFLIAYQNSRSLLYLFVLSYNSVSTTSKHVLLSYTFDNVFLNDMQKYFGTLQGTFFEKNWSYKDDFLLTHFGNNCVLPGSYTSCACVADLDTFSKFIKSIDISSISFIFTDVEEAFSTQIWVCSIFTFVTVVPIIVYETVSFFASSFYVAECKKWVSRLFYLVVSWYIFLYCVQTFLIPKFAEFLLLFEISSPGFNLLAETKIASYCSWALSIFLITNLFFYLVIFVFICLLNEKDKIQNVIVKKKTSAAIVFLISALLTPPDFIQVILAVFLFFCFELFVCSCCIYKHFLIKSLNQKKRN